MYIKTESRQSQEREVRVDPLTTKTNSMTNVMAKEMANGVDVVPAEQRENLIFNSMHSRHLSSFAKEYLIAETKKSQPYADNPKENFSHSTNLQSNFARSQAIPSPVLSNEVMRLSQELAEANSRVGRERKKKHKYKQKVTNLKQQIRSQNTEITKLHQDIFRL